MPTQPDDVALPIALWAAPRSRSTAFERTFVERGDFDVVHEPFSATYYRSHDRRSDRYLDGEPRPDASARQVLAEIERPRERRVFVKDMAYHTAGFMDDGLAARFANSFLIRHPRNALASLHDKLPTFTFEEAGYEQLARLYDIAAADGRAAPVIDADDLVRDPDTMMRAYCAAMDITYVEAALSWQAEKVSEFSEWDSWHQRAQDSTGLGDIEPSDRPLPDHLEDVYQRCLPHYRRLHAERLVAA